MPAGWKAQVAPQQVTSASKGRERADTFVARAASEKHFQKRRVSSAAAEQTVVPSGDCARCSTRDVWPVISATCATSAGALHVEVTHLPTGLTGSAGLADDDLSRLHKGDQDASLLF